MENIKIITVSKRIKTKMRCLFVFIIIFIFLMEKVTSKQRLKFEYLDLSSQQVQMKILSNVPKFKSIHLDEISNLNITNIDQLEQKIKILLLKIKSHFSLKENDYILITSVISFDESLTNMVFQNFLHNKMLKIFKYFKNYQLRRQFLKILLENQLLAFEFFSSFSYLEQSLNRKAFLKHIFSKNIPQINQILLRSIDLSLFKNQRCVLSKFSTLRNLRDHQQYKLNQQQKEMLISIIVRENSLCQLILTDATEKK